MVAAVLIFGTSLALLIGFSILVAKICFVKRLLAAKADINIFNQSLAICLLASGKFEAGKQLSTCFHGLAQTNGLKLIEQII